MCWVFNTTNHSRYAELALVSIIGMFFSQKKAFGIDISDYSIELLELEEKGGHIQIQSYGREVLKKGVMDNGVILKEEKLKEVIQKLLDGASPKKPTSSRVVASLPESKTYIHTFRLPKGLKYDEIHKTIVSQAQKIIPFSKEDVASDFSLGSVREKKQEVLFAASPQTIVKSYKKVFKQLHLELVALDLESASIARAISFVEDLRAPALVLDIGARTSNITIMEKGGSVRNSFLIHSAGSHLTDALARGLDISYDKAEELKKHAGLDPGYKEGKVFLVLQKVLAQVIEEIQSVRKFFKEESGEEIKKMYLVGGGALLPDLPSYISQNTGLETSVFVPWPAREAFPEEISGKMHPVNFTNVIGLALRGARPNPGRSGINLFTLPEKSKKSGNMLNMFRK